MRIPKFQIILLAILIITIFAGCKSNDKPEKNIVATYDGGHKVTISELNKFISDWLYTKRFPKKSDAFHNGLHDLLLRQFKRMDFFAEGLDKNKELIKSVQRVINEELVTSYFEKEYLGKYANEETAKNVYKNMNKQVIAQQIVLQKPKGASAAQIDSIKQKALNISSEIAAGKDFNSLVKQYSQDKQSAGNDGYMPPVEWKQSISDPVGNVIFRLNVNDVRVLNDNKAIRIVKVVKINNIPVDSFDKAKNGILKYLKNAYYEVGIDDYEKDKKKLIDENSLKWNENALRQIMNWSNELNFYRDKYKETFNNAIANNDNKTILTYNKGKVDFKEYLWLLNNILTLPESKKNVTVDYLKKFILEAIRTKFIVEKADSLDLIKEIFNPFTDNPVLKFRLVYLYNQAEVEAKIPDTTDEALHQFFKANENGMYYQLEKRNIFVMVFPNKDEAEKALEKIKQGTPFEKISGSYLVKTYIKDRNGEIKTFRNNDKPVFGEVSFKMKESEVSGPIKFEDASNQTKYAVLKCYHIRPEKQLTFEDVKNTIAKDFRDYYREKIEQEVEKKLMDKYHPVINEDVLANLISSK